MKQEVGWILVWKGHLVWVRHVPIILTHSIPKNKVDHDLSPLKCGLLQLLFIGFQYLRGEGFYKFEEVDETREVHKFELNLSAYQHQLVKQKLIFYFYVSWQLLRCMIKEILVLIIMQFLRQFSRIFSFFPLDFYFSNELFSQ